MEAIAGPGARGLGPRLIVDTPVAAFEVPVDQYRRFRVRVRLQAGINRAEIRFPDLDRNVEDRRRLCVSQFRVEAVPPRP